MGLCPIAVIPPTLDFLVAQLPVFKKSPVAVESDRPTSFLIIVSPSR